MDNEKSAEESRYKPKTRILFNFGPHNHNVDIVPVDNGFILQIGCYRGAFERSEAGIHSLLMVVSEYLRKPMEAEHDMNNARRSRHGELYEQPCDPGMGMTEVAPPRPCP